MCLRFHAFRGPLSGAKVTWISLVWLLAAPANLSCALPAVNIGSWPRCSTPARQTSGTSWSLTLSALVVTTHVSSISCVGRSSLYTAPAQRVLLLHSLARLSPPFDDPSTLSCTLLTSHLMM